MSLLCSCVGKKGKYSPKHTTYDREMSSKLKQPSTSRYGFASSKPRKESAPASIPCSSTELKAVKNCSSPRKSGGMELGLTGGLALDPSALLQRRCNDSLGGYVPRGATLNDKPRPMSSIASLGQSNQAQESDSGFNSFDDAKTHSKPKSTLRSLFSRSFYRDKTTADKIARHTTGSNGSINNSKSEGMLGSLKQHPRSSIGSTGSSSSNHSTDSRSKLSFKHNSLGPSRIQNSSPTPQITQIADSKSSTGGYKSLQSKLVTAKAKSSPSVPKSSGSGPTKYSSQQKSKSPKPTKLAYPTNEPTSSSVAEDQCQSKQQSAELLRVHNNNVSVDERKEGLNIDPGQYNAISEASAPVAKGDTDSETETSFNGVNDLSTPCSTSSSATTRSARSMSAGSASGDKKKPTIEINPLTKEDNPCTVQIIKEEESEKMGLNKKSLSTPSRTFTIDEELLSAIMSEVASLKSTVVELQHHLIGKQEHEDKMREELKIKNEIINNLKHELAHCRCQQKNVYVKLPDDEIITTIS